MKQYLFIFFGTLLFLNKLYASPINLDIYGVDINMQNKIRTCCYNKIREYVQLQQQLNLAQKGNSEQDLKRLQLIEKSIQKKINALDNFSTTKISTVYYPGDKTTYTTIDLVKASDAYRLPVSSVRRIKKKIVKNEELTHLFKVWDDYNKKNLKLMQNSNLDFKSKSCPVIHCIWGFDKNELLYEVPELKKGASKHKNQLVEIIEHSSNNSDREQAIFILAHISNYEELANFLMKFTNDADESVRNNAMRVLGAILAQHNVAGLDIERILKALDYPYVTDRNKAGYVLLNIVLKDKSSHPLVIKKSGKTLINLLKLNQPNNHEFAYRILQVLSSKNYSERDYKNWKKWLDSENDKLNR